MTIGQPVIAVERSSNRKIGEASATYVSQATCPGSCPFRNAGCYAETGFTGLQTNRVNKAGEDWDPEDVALLEAEMIGELTGEYPLRVHVVGDSPSDTSARLVSAAMRRHQQKKGQPAWTYTHAWRDVSHRSWNKQNVLASCETAAEVRQAQRKGYATCRVVGEFEEQARHTTADGTDLIPCPNQTRGRTCAECRLCMRADWLRKEKVTIGFAAHGSGSRKVKETVSG